MRLFLCHCGRKIQAHFGIVFEREDMLGFKEDAHWWTHSVEHTDDGNAVDDIPGKTGYALCDNEIDLSCFAIGDHPVECITLV